MVKQTWFPNILFICCAMDQISISASRLQSKVFDAMSTAKATKLNVYDVLGTALIDAGNDLGNNLPYGHLNLKDTYFTLEILKCVCVFIVKIWLSDVWSQRICFQTDYEFLLFCYVLTSYWICIQIKAKFDLTLILSGDSLVKTGSVQQKIAGAQREYSQAVAKVLINPLKNFLDGDMKTIEVQVALLTFSREFLQTLLYNFRKNWRLWRRRGWISILQKVVTRRPKISPKYEIFILCAH